MRRMLGWRRKMDNKTGKLRVEDIERKAKMYVGRENEKNVYIEFRRNERCATFREEDNPG